MFEQIAESLPDERVAELRDLFAQGRQLRTIHRQDFDDAAKGLIELSLWRNFRAVLQTVVPQGEDPPVAAAIMDELRELLLYYNPRTSRRLHLSDLQHLASLMRELGRWREARPFVHTYPTPM